MKTITNFLFLLVAAVCFVACEKDGDKIYLNSIEAGDLMASESEVVLSQDNSKEFCHWHGRGTIWLSAIRMYQLPI